MQKTQLPSVIGKLNTIQIKSLRNIPSRQVVQSTFQYLFIAKRVLWQFFDNSDLICSCTLSSILLRNYHAQQCNNIKQYITVTLILHIPITPGQYSILHFTGAKFIIYNKLTILYLTINLTILYNIVRLFFHSINPHKSFICK